MTTQAVARRRKARKRYPKTQDGAAPKRQKRIPEYLEADEVNSIIRAAPSPTAKLLMLEQWRAGLRDLTIEHVMPRGWRSDWKLPSDVEDEEMTKSNRDRLIHTMGNLTLARSSPQHKSFQSSLGREAGGIARPYHSLPQQRTRQRARVERRAN